MIVAKKNNLILFFIIFCSLFLYVIFSNYSNYVLIDRFLLIVILILNLFPFFFLLTNEREQNLIPVFYLALVYFFICYSSFYFFDYWHLFIDSTSGEHGKAANYEPTDIRLSLKLFSLALLFFNIGYFALQKFFKNGRKGFAFLKIKDNKEIIVIALLVYFFVLFTYYFLKIQNIVPGLAQIKYPLSYLSIGLIFFYILRKKELALYKKIILSSLIIFIFFLELLQGSFAYSFTILIFLYVIFFYCKKKIVILPLIIGCLIFTFFHSFKIDFRELTWKLVPILNIDKEKVVMVKEGRKEEMSLTEKGERFLKSMTYFSQKFYEADLNVKINKLIKENVVRIYHSAESLRLVSKLSPKHIPYWEGYSYKILLTKLIPRIFWKNKPSDTLGNKFGHRYKVLNPEDYHTSWNMPVVNEFYVNFGTAGITVGMFLLGLFFRLLVSFFSINNKNSYEMIIGIITVFPLFFLESHLSLLFGGVLQTFVFLFIFILIAKNFLRLIHFHND